MKLRDKKGNSVTKAGDGMESNPHSNTKTHNPKFILKKYMNAVERSV